MKIVALTVFTMCAMVASAQWIETTLFSGRITDPSGASIRGVLVTVQWNTHRANGPSKPDVSNVSLQTDGFGEFAVRLTPGFYDVCVHAAAFSPTCETVAVGEHESSVYRETLKLNSLILSERRDLIDILDMGPNSLVPTAPPQMLPDSIPYAK